MPTPLYPESPEYGELVKGSKRVLDYFLSPELQAALLPLKIAFIVISVIFVLAIVYFIFKTDYLKWAGVEDAKNFFFPRTLARRGLARQWGKIKKSLEKSKMESQWKVSLIKGLALFDKKLEKMGYGGKSFTERLSKISSEEVSNLEELQRAGRVCQDVVRDPDYQLSKEEAQRVLEAFERALTEFGVM